MTDNNLTQKDKLPLATAKEKDGIVLYWIEELGVAGISFKGLGRLLDCDDRTVANLFQGTEVSSTFEAETVTDGGVQVLKLISESDLAVVLTTVVGSRCKAETRKNAAVALTKLASAGFKLLVMMELAPEQLASQAQQHAKTIEGDRLRELELEVRMLKMQAEIHELKEAINKRPIVDAQPSQPPQTIDSPSDLSEAVRRRNLAEMEAACTPGTEEYKSAIAVRDWLNRN